MANGDALIVVDRLLRDIMGSTDATLDYVPFGGKVMICSGDWRQFLPVVPRGTRPQNVKATCKAT